MRRWLLTLYDLIVILGAGVIVWTILFLVRGAPAMQHDTPDVLWPLLQPIAHDWIYAVGGFGVLLIGNVGLRTRKPADRDGNKHERSELDLSDIPADAPDRVERVAQALSKRGSTESVEVSDLVDDIIVAAVFLGASDVHIEPKESSTRLSFRMDGLMKDLTVFPKARSIRLLNRFRVIAKLDIAQADSPQDGRIENKIRGKAMNLRVSVFPTLYGPKVVLRLLDAGAHALPPLPELGIRPNVLERFRKLIHAPQGIVLFTGPTGSGKTTIMYAALREVMDSEETRKNIVTLEDPIERVLPDINQTPVDDKKGLSFAAGLRTILRQDPDIIMVGEIRDLQTAEIALRAGQTGHLLMSTLHTNSAAAAFGRLIDMGIEPFLLASSVTGVVSVRLVRRLCLKCRVRKEPTQLLLSQLPPGVLPADIRFYEGTGCENCRNTGFLGRLMVFELLEMNDDVANAIVRKLSSAEIAKIAEAHGMSTIMSDGLAKVSSGLTSLKELLRVVQ
jgi:type II secretory ATPase GspE/PulE/Tfp pilus assembly ATPase PilB-like protein